MGRNVHFELLDNHSASWANLNIGSCIKEKTNVAKSKVEDASKKKLGSIEFPALGLFKVDIRLFV